jgi:cytochrome c peroxidase
MQSRLLLFSILGLCITLLIIPPLGFSQAMPTPYNPYPPGILPGDLVAEIARVRQEVQFIFNQALAESNALGPVTFTGNPPTIQGNGYRAVQALGKLLNFDENMSPFRNRACAFCHMPYVGFSGPIPSVNATIVAYPGSFEFRAGKRTAQRYTYSPRFPVLQFNPTQQLFFGGNFWDSRSTGLFLQSPDSEQAQHPPVDPLEMANPDTACIAFKISQAVYRPLFEEIWGADSLNINFPPSTAQICATPGGAAVFGTSTMPVPLSPADRQRANEVYNHWGQSISFYEDGPEVSPYTSKFDAFLKGTATLSATEMAGYNLFRGKAGCNTCHLDGRGSTQTPGTGSGNTPSTTTGTDTSAVADVTPLFTCFGSANLGLPLNPRIALFYETTPDFFGFTPNPFGFGFRDLGLGTFLRSGFGSAPNPVSDWIPLAPTVDGQMQVSTARNVAMVPLCPPGSPANCVACPTTEAPGPFFQKEFFHNGYIKSLKQLVHFYNTRDVFSQNVASGQCPPGMIERVNCWPVPEVPGVGFGTNQGVFQSSTVDMTVGNLGLSSAEEDQIVAFLQTLTDGFTTPFPNINTFTGACRTGGTAATQGNDILIPTPPLPPCTAAICGVPPVPNPPIVNPPQPVVRSTQ